jgi:hypothetical protein
MRVLPTLTSAALGALALPAVATAHGIRGEATNKTTLADDGLIGKTIAFNAGTAQHVPEWPSVRRGAYAAIAAAGAVGAAVLVAA